jgi:ABC-type Fe3+/spermidine/putrescine transport system ATPase subunit
VFEQVGSPSEIYERPASRFVLSFVGFSNFLRVTEYREVASLAECRLAGAIVSVNPSRIPGAAAGATEIAIRPERVRIVGTAGAIMTGNHVPGTVQDVTYEGALLTYEIALADGQSLVVREPNQGTSETVRRLAVGDPVTVGWRPEDAVLVG